MAVGNVVACYGMFMSPADVPLDRILKTAEGVLAENPESAEAHYTFARIHYLAFVNSSRTVPAFTPEKEGGAVRIPDDYGALRWMMDKRLARAREIAVKELADKSYPSTEAKQQAQEELAMRHFKNFGDENGGTFGELTVEQMTTHATAALREFQIASQLEPRESLYTLGMACLVEEVAEWRLKEKPADLPQGLAILHLQTAQGLYLKAFRATFDKDARVKSLGPQGAYELISFEAGEGYLRVSERLLKQGKISDERIRKQVQAHVDRVEKIPHGSFTPMIFTRHPVAGIGDLLATDTQVDFDLRGYGPRERWNWLRPDTGLLVWDPTGTGQIVSGRQLFGGYTFQIFRATGYDALAALDDDGDGVLHGKELEGVRAWFDRNGDGRSTPEEVVDLETLGIVGIAVRATGRDGMHPTNPAGLILNDGRTLPTWDWMAEPVRD